MSFTRLALPRCVGSEYLYVSCTDAFVFICGCLLRPSHTQFGVLHSPGRWVCCVFLCWCQYVLVTSSMHLIAPCGTMHWVGESQFISLHMRFAQSYGIISTYLGVGSVSNRVESRSATSDIVVDLPLSTGRPGVILEATIWDEGRSSHSIGVCLVSVRSISAMHCLVHSHVMVPSPHSGRGFWMLSRLSQCLHWSVGAGRILCSRS